MLEAPAEALALSTTMPLVPLGSSTGVPLTIGLLVMSKDRMQPLVSPLVHCAPTDTKRMSVPPPMVGLKNSVKGEQGLLFPAESARTSVGPVTPVVFMAEPVKPVTHNGATPLPPPGTSEPD